ncbi:MAG: UDP-2,3-diacylglucosamine diphosphatase LpxI, partial [Pseudomonadota bacterium]
MADALDGLAIVAGAGVLPRMLAEDCARSGRAYGIVKFEGVALDWLEGHPVIPAVYEKPGRLFKDLKRAGLSEVSFAGGMTRPRISPLRFDLKAIRLAPQLFKALKGGDDAALRIVSEIFEAEGLRIVAAHEVLETLLEPAGVLSKRQPSEADRADAARAAAIVEALGSVDVGQGAVVAQGI